MILCFLIASSCSRKHSDSLPAGIVKSTGGSRPPAYVQKAWDARYSYDSDRRLLVPEYAGSRWGAVQQYKEEGKLVYQDWWVRDVRSEDLEASPDISITSYLDDDGNLTLIVQDVDSEANKSEELSPSVKSTFDPFSDNSSPFPPAEEEAPFETSPFSPF
jgi:hypothetical protein